MSYLYKLKQNKSFDDIDNVTITTNFIKLTKEFQKLRHKYPLSLYYMTNKIFTKKERIKRLENFFLRYT